MAKRYDDNAEPKPQYGGGASKHKDPHPKDPQCQTQSGLLRCTLPAAWYLNNGTRGYCWLHDEQAKQLMGPDLFDQLQDIRDNRQRFINEHEGENWRRMLVDDCIEAHPQWVRGEDEGKRAYQLRMLAEGKSLGRRLRKQQHVTARSSK